MRCVVVGLGLVALAGCSKAPERGGERTASYDVAEAPASGDNAPAAPGIAVTAAPGVAFNYRYAFKLPPAAIAAAQESHAQACEKLGIARCRITGMRYRLLGENDVEAMLAFKLDPALARGFGRNGIATVQAAKGTLVDAEITGTDAGAAIDQAGGDRARATDVLARIDAQLASSGRGAAERTVLPAQRAEAQRRVDAARADAATNRASLATTPMVFDYASGSAVRGFDASAPLTSALDTVIASSQTTLAVLLGTLAIFGPPLLLIALLWLGWRRFGVPVRARLARRRDE